MIPVPVGRLRFFKPGEEPVEFVDEIIVRLIDEGEHFLKGWIAGVYNARRLGDVLNVAITGELRKMGMVQGNGNVFDWHCLRRALSVTAMAELPCQRSYRLLRLPLPERGETNSSIFVGERIEDVIHSVGVQPEEGRERWSESAG
jgi:hypothetical protein